MEKEQKAPRLKTVGLAEDVWRDLKLYALEQDASLSEAVRGLLEIRQKVVAQRTKKGAEPKNQR